MSKKIYLYFALTCLTLSCFAFWQLPRHRQKSEIALVSPASAAIHIRAVGDIMLGRAVNVQSQKQHDFNWPFLGTVPYLPSADIFIGNLENPLISNCPPTVEGMIFCAPPAAATGLSFAQVNLVSLANNHSLNYGRRGLETTEQILDDHDIKHLRHGEKLTRIINNIPVEVVAYDDLTYPLTQSVIAGFHRSPVTIAYIHWGNEYQPHPSVRQQTIVGWLLDSGVDIILGSHPHVLQPIEQPQSNQLIAYSLGNFIFDQMWSEATRKGIILDLHLTITNQQLSTIRYQPTYTTIYDYGQPRLEQKIK